MLKKDANPNWFEPDDNAISAFEKLKTRLISSSVLDLPQRDRPYKIDTDASAYHLGAAPLQ